MRKIKPVLLALALTALMPVQSAFAIEHPGCTGKKNEACDIFAMLLNLRGKGCYRLMQVDPMGEQVYLLTCELASTNRKAIKYLLMSLFICPPFMVAPTAGGSGQAMANRPVGRGRASTWLRLLLLFDSPDQVGHSSYRSSSG